MTSWPSATSFEPMVLPTTPVPRTPIFIAVHLRPVSWPFTIASQLGHRLVCRHPSRADRDTSTLAVQPGHARRRIAIAGGGARRYHTLDLREVVGSELKLQCT